MGLSNEHLLLVVNSLHFFNAGLVAPAITHHITTNGGNHVILGCLISVLFLCNKLSKDVIAIFVHNTKSAINVCMYASFVSYLGLVFYSLWWEICLFKILSGITNQVWAYSKEYLAKTVLGAERGRLFNLLDVARNSCIVTGSVCGGYLFECTGKFASVAMVTTCLTFVCILLLQYVDDDTTNIRRSESRLLSGCYRRIKHLTEIDYRPQWDRIVLQMTFRSVFVIYFSRFVLLISFNYRVGFVVIGYSVAYQHMLKFASAYLASSIKARVSNKTKFFDFCLLVCGATLVSVYYAPSYELYLILFVPMVFSYAAVNSLLSEDDVLDFRSKNGLDEALETLNILIRTLVPICFGIIIYFCGGYSFKIFSIFPCVICVYFVKKGLIELQKEEEAGVKGNLSKQD